MHRRILSRMEDPVRRTTAEGESASCPTGSREDAACQVASQHQELGTKESYTEVIHLEPLVRIGTSRGEPCDGGKLPGYAHPHPRLPPPKGADAELGPGACRDGNRTGDPHVRNPGERWADVGRDQETPDGNHSSDQMSCSPPSPPESQQPPRLSVPGRTPDPRDSTQRRPPPAEYRATSLRRRVGPGAEQPAPDTR